MKPKVPFLIGPNEVKANEAGLVSLTDGHVYVIEVADNICKIGASNNPAARVKTHAAALPNDFANVFVSKKVCGYMQMEKAVHTSLRHCLIRNEVFGITFSEAVSLVTKTADSFHAAQVERTVCSNPERQTKQFIEELISSLERKANVEIASNHNFSPSVGQKAEEIWPNAAAVAIAAFLCDEAPSVEIAYAAIVLEHANQPVQVAA